MAPKVVVRDNDPHRPEEATTSIGFRIEATTAEKLQDICIREGVSKSAIIKRLIRQYVEENYDGRGKFYEQGKEKERSL